MQDITFNINGADATDSVIAILLSLYPGDSVKFNRSGGNFTLVKRYIDRWEIEFRRTGPEKTRARRHHPLDVGWVAESVVNGRHTPRGEIMVHTPEPTLVVHKAGCTDEDCMGECLY